MCVCRKIVRDSIQGISEYLSASPPRWNRRTQALTYLFYCSKVRYPVKDPSKSSQKKSYQPNLRRLARRGGVKRISGDIYEAARGAMTDRLKIVSAALMCQECRNTNAESDGF